MKKTYKYSLNLALAALVCLFLANPANAQRPGSGGGGGGGGSSRPSGGGSSGGGGGSPRPSVAPSSNSSSSFSRPAGMPAPQRSSVVQGGGVRQGNAVRGNNGYAPRQGAQVIRGNSGYAPRVGTSTLRGNYGYAPRTALSGGVGVRGGTIGGSNYRSYPAIGYGHAGYWGSHNYIYHNRGYYNSYYLPSIGFACTVLPYGYYPFYYGDEQYYFSNGLYYQYDNNQYTVVEPPVGAEVTTLPDKAQSIVINGQQYYELNGVYYQPVTKDDGTKVYEVAGKDGELNTNTVDDSQQQQGPQMGDIVNQLPQDCRKITVNGQKLYVSPDGIYYQEIVDANGNKTYKIVGLPTDEPDQQQGQN